MKALLINGSPHETGATFRALEEAAHALNTEGVETEILWLGVKPVAGCIACGQCAKTGKCFMQDMVNATIDKMAAADGLIVGAPVYYAGPCAQLTAFLDRFFYAAPKSVLAYKPAACAVNCRRGGASAAFDRLNKYFTISHMPVVSSQYWNQTHGFTAEDVQKDEEGLQTMRMLGRNMAWLMKCIEAGKKAAVLPPVPETPLRTHFIR